MQSMLCLHMIAVCRCLLAYRHTYKNLYGYHIEPRVQEWIYKEQSLCSGWFSSLLFFFYQNNLSTHCLILLATTIANHKKFGGVKYLVCNVSTYNIEINPVCGTCVREIECLPTFCFYGGLTSEFWKHNGSIYFHTFFCKCNKKWSMVLHLKNFWFSLQYTAPCPLCGSSRNSNCWWL